MGFSSCRLRLRLIALARGCDCLGVEGSVAFESAGLDASMMLCEPEGERRGAVSDTGLTRAAISMLAEWSGRHKYSLCSRFFVDATRLAPA